MRCRRDVIDVKTRFQNDEKTRFRSDDSEERDESVSPQMRRTLISRRPGSDPGLIRVNGSLYFWEMAWVLLYTFYLF